MLGFDALGRLAIGQVSDGGASTIILTASAGAFTLSGQAALFRVNQVSAAGSFTLSGQAALFRPSLVSAAGAFTLSGQDVAFELTAKLLAETGSFLFTGSDATLTRDFVNWLPSGDITSNWSAAADDSDTWTPAADDSDEWTASGSGSTSWTPASSAGSTWTAT